MADFDYNTAAPLVAALEAAQSALNTAVAEFRRPRRDNSEPRPPIGDGPTLIRRSPSTTFEPQLL